MLILLLGITSVPSMVSDLADSSAFGHPLEGLLFGGASAPDWLARTARQAFPGAMANVPLFASDFRYRKLTVWDGFPGARAMA